MLNVQEALHQQSVSHEGQTAEEAYLEKMKNFHLQEGVIEDGPTVVSTLMMRCSIWYEIIEQK